MPLLSLSSLLTMAFRYESCSSLPTSGSYIGSGMADASSSFNFVRFLSWQRRWYVISDRAVAIVRLPAMAVTWPSYHSQEGSFLRSGISLLKDLVENGHLGFVLSVWVVAMCIFIIDVPRSVLNKPDRADQNFRLELSA
jgi:hypothetical protein